MALDAAVRRRARAVGAVRLEMWLDGDTEAAEILRRLGWEERVQPDINLAIRIFDPRVRPAAVEGLVYLTMGDSELACAVELIVLRGTFSLLGVVHVAPRRGGIGLPFFLLLDSLLLVFSGRVLPARIHLSQGVAGEGLLGLRADAAGSPGQTDLELRLGTSWDRLPCLFPQGKALWISVRIGGGAALNGAGQSKLPFLPQLAVWALGVAGGSALEAVARVVAMDLDTSLATSEIGCWGGGGNTRGPWNRVGWLLALVARFTGRLRSRRGTVRRGHSSRYAPSVAVRGRATGDPLDHRRRLVSRPGIRSVPFLRNYSAGGRPRLERRRRPLHAVVSPALVLAVAEVGMFPTAFATVISSRLAWFPPGRHSSRALVKPKARVETPALLPAACLRGNQVDEKTKAGGTCSFWRPSRLAKVR